MNQKIISVLIGGVSLVMSGCGHFEVRTEADGRPMTRERCEYDDAYARGHNDATAGAEMNLDFARGCFEKSDSAKEAYRDGFEAFLAEKAELERQKAAAARPDDNGPKASNSNTININVGGVQAVEGGKGMGRNRGQRREKFHAQRNDKKYYCEATAFSKTYTALAPTRMEGQKMVLDECTQNYHKMHCKVSCKENR